MLKIHCDTMQVDAKRRGGGGVEGRCEQEWQWGARVEGSEFQHVISEIEF